MALFCSFLVVELFKITMNPKLFICSSKPVYLLNASIQVCTHLSKWSTPFRYWHMYNCYKLPTLYVYGILVEHLPSKHWNSFPFSVPYYLSARYMYNWWCIFIISNMIGNHIFCGRNHGILLHVTRSLFRFWVQN